MSVVPIIAAVFSALPIDKLLFSPTINDDGVSTYLLSPLVLDKDKSPYTVPLGETPTEALYELPLVTEVFCLLSIIIFSTLLLLDYFSLLL